MNELYVLVYEGTLETYDHGFGEMMVYVGINAAMKAANDIDDNMQIALDVVFLLPVERLTVSHRAATAE